MLAAPVAPPVPAGPPSDAVGIGLVLASVGGFLLANSIVFRHPRSLLADYFGRRQGKLTSIRGYIFHRLQIHLGFLFLLLGFGLQLYGHYNAPPVSTELLDEEIATRFPIAWVGVVLVSVAVLEVGGWWLSHALFRRYIRDYFREHPPNLEADMALTQELGDLFGISSGRDDTVESYLMRLRSRIGLPGNRRPTVTNLPDVRTFRGLGPEEGLV